MCAKLQCHVVMKLDIFPERGLGPRPSAERGSKPSGGRRPTVPRHDFSPHEERAPAAGAAAGIKERTAVALEMDQRGSRLVVATLLAATGGLSLRLVRGSRDSTFRALSLSFSVSGPDGGPVMYTSAEGTRGIKTTGTVLNIVVHHAPGLLKMRARCAPHSWKVIIRVRVRRARHLCFPYPSRFL